MESKTNIVQIFYAEFQRIEDMEKKWDYEISKRRIQKIGLRGRKNIFPISKISIVFLIMGF